jgi:hypothetical protein
MDVKLSKLTPARNRDPKGDYDWIAYADFDVITESITFKIKGCLVLQIKIGLAIRLPRLKRAQDKEEYSPFVFGSQEDANEFFIQARQEIKDKWSPERWKHGIWSKFNQGLKK